MSSVGSVVLSSCTLPPSVCKMTFSGRLLGPACAEAGLEGGAAPEGRDVSAGTAVVEDTDEFTA